MTLNLSRAHNLKQDLIDFTFDAEGELAEAFEAYSAEQLAQLADSPYQGSRKTEQVVDSFAVEGVVGSQSILDLFIAGRSDLSADERSLITGWQHSFMGLFAVVEKAADQMTVMNWLTEKQYEVLLPTPPDQNLARLQPKEIVLTRLLPVGERWMLSGPAVYLGKLGKPKLAVAIGSFKKYHKDYLYGDAPELLEEAWQSVERYHQSFVDYFGSHDITLSGHQLEKKLSDFQAQMTEQQLAASGLDGEKSLKELADEAGVSEEEMTETAAAMGVDEKTTARLLETQNMSKMMMPKIELPKHLKGAEQVTVVTHPRWGQVMTTDYQPLIAELNTEDQSALTVESQAQKCLKNLEIKPFVWQQLAQQYPVQLERVLQRVLSRPDLNLEQDLDSILADFDHPTQPELPETASVPLHLHNLFQDALLEVSRPKSSKSKGREKLPKKTGFG